MPIDISNDIKEQAEAIGVELGEKAHLLALLVQEKAEVLKRASVEPGFLVVLNSAKEALKSHAMILTIEASDEAKDRLRDIVFGAIIKTAIKVAATV